MKIRTQISSLFIVLIIVLQNVHPAAAGVQASPLYYLYPPNLHLVSGETSAIPLTVRDNDGNTLAGTTLFSGYDTSLISISPTGYVTALRAEGAVGTGTWVTATYNGKAVANTTVVRVLSTAYTVPFSYVTRTHTALYYPTHINGEDLSALVSRFEIANVNEYAYLVQYQLMNVPIFDGARQIFEVDFGETEQQRVCGISGNPVRLGWNIQGNTWQNCFLVPFIDPRSPQWFIMHHELGHNFTWQSPIFGSALGGNWLYSEGMASALSLTDMETVLQNSTLYPIGADTAASLNQQLTMYEGNFASNYQDWLDKGADFSQVTPDAIDGIWLHYKAQRPSDFAERFFLPLRPEYYPRLANLVSGLGESDKHTIFAALVSAVVRQDLSADFSNTYHFPLNTELFSSAYSAFSRIIDPTYLIYLPLVSR